MMYSSLASLLFWLGTSFAQDDHVKLLCRNHPTWRDLSEEDVNCSKVLGYDPNQFDVLEGVENEVGYGGAENGEEYPKWMQTMYDCMAEKAKLHSVEETEEELPEPHITNLYPSRDTPLMATVEFAMSEQEKATLLDLKDCVQSHHEGQFEHRSFAYEGLDEEAAEARGGNDVTFLAGFLQLFAPGVASQVYNVGHRVWKEAKWGEITQVVDEEENDVFYPYPDPYKCGIRTTEHLSYNGWAGLGAHDDGESMYTVLFAFRDPSEYEGGEYYLDPSTWRGNNVDAKIIVKPTKLSAVVFLSEEYHGVMKIHSGTREMFTTEIWKQGDVPVARLRPTPAEYLHFKETGEWVIVDESAQSEESTGDTNEELNEEL